MPPAPAHAPGPPAVVPPRKRREPARRQLGEPDALKEACAVCDILARLHREVADVRRPPQQRVVEHRHVDGQLGRLGHVRQRASPLASGHGDRGLARDAHLALVVDQAGHCAQEGRLPGPVRPDEADPLPPSHRRRDRVDGGTRPETHRHRAQLDHGTALGRADAAAATAFGQTDDPGHQVSPAPMPRPALRETRTTRKKGAPIHAVTTPIGTSAGAWTVRATRSVPIRKAAPPTMATGRMMR